MSDQVPAAPAAPSYTGGDVIQAASTPVAPTEVPASPAPAPATTSAPVGESASATSTQPITSSQTESGGPSPSTSPSDAALPAAPAQAAPKPNEFQPSLLEGAPDSAAKPADKPADAGKPSEAPGETPSAPKYEFTYPEGFDRQTVNAERMSAYTGVLGESKIAPEVGQKLLDMHLAEINTAAEKIAQRQWDIFNETQNKWRDEAKADPEIGGENFAKSIQTIMGLVDLYGGNAAERAQLLEAFKITGAGNNPSMLRFMHRAAQSLSREATPTPAPPPRMPQSAGRERGLSRYQGSTPFKG